MAVYVYVYGQTAARLYKELEENIWAQKSNKPQKSAPVKRRKSSWFWIPKRTKVHDFVPDKALPEVTFRQAMMIPLLFGQILGLNPVAGLFQRDPAQVKFHFKSWKLLYSVLLCLVQAVATSLSIYRLFQYSMNQHTLSFVFFYGSTCLTSALFLSVATKWPALMLEVEATEMVDTHLDGRLKWKCQVASFTVLFLAFVVARCAEIMDCFPNETSLYKAYIERTFPWLFELDFPHFLPSSIILQVLNVYFTINWSYSELFIICISFYLTSRLEQINKKLAVAKGKYLPSDFWRTVREDYNRVTRLVRKFDDIISGVIFTSFAMNLFFICLQLFNTLGKGIKHGLSVDQCPNFPSGIFNGYEHAVYFLFSLIFLIARSFMVLMIAAGVHSASLEPAETLYSVPSPVYCTEVQRFLEQLHGQTVTLTGLRFFNISRGLVLSVAGTIVTYELVLLQFSMTDTNTSSTSMLAE